MQPKPKQSEGLKKIAREKPWTRFPPNPQDKNNVQNKDWWKQADDEKRARWWMKFVGPPQNGIFYIEDSSNKSNQTSNAVNDQPESMTDDEFLQIFSAED